MKTVQIECKKDLSSLAGYDYGVQVYNTQIAPISISETIQLIIPENIVYVSSSFIQGLIKEIVELCVKNNVYVKDYFFVKALSNSSFIQKSFDRYIQ